MPTTTPRSGSQPELVQAEEEGRRALSRQDVTPIALQGSAQMAGTEHRWGIRPMDLMQMHSLVDWRGHLPRLRTRDAGRRHTRGAPRRDPPKRSGG